MKKVLGYVHGLINYIDTKAKCRHLKRFTSKGVFLFEAQNAVPPPPPPPTHCIRVYTDTVYLITQGRGGEFISNRYLPQSPFTGQFFRWRHFALVSIWLRSPWMGHIVLLQGLYFDTSSFFLANLPDWCSLHHSPLLKIFGDYPFKEGLL
jgi:hypothetical protein